MLGSYLLLRAVSVTRSSCAEQPQVSVSLIDTSWTSQLWWSWATIPYQSCYCNKKLLRGAATGFCVSSSILLENPNWGVVGQPSPIRAVIVTKRSSTKQLKVFVSLFQHFLRLPLGAELRSYPLLELLLSEEVPARCSRRFFVFSPILLETLNWDGVGQLSPIRAVIVIRSFCHVAVLIIVSLFQYFKCLWIWVVLGSYPLLELLLS